MSGYERRVEAHAAYDKRHPDPAQNYGIHGVEFRFSLIGELAAVSLGISTGWQLPSVVGSDGESSMEYRTKLRALDPLGAYPLPMALGFHLAEPCGYMIGRESSPCDLLPGGQCWGDVTFTGADRPFFALVERGVDGLWDQLAAEIEQFKESAA